jgi:hypothetical protein
VLADSRRAAGWGGTAAVSLGLILTIPAILAPLLSAAGMVLPTLSGTAAQEGPGAYPWLATLAHLLLLSLWAFLVAVDERGLGPLGFHEPLVAGVGTGMLLGCFPAGLAMGLLLQAIWPGLLPLGTARQPVAGLGAITGTFWLVCLPRPLGLWVIPLALGVALTAAAWGEVAEAIWRRRNAARHTWAGSLSAQRRSGIWTVLQIAGLLELGRTGALGLLAFVGLPLAAVALLDRLTGAAAGVRGSAGANAMGGAGEMGLEFWLSAASFGALFALGGIVGRSVGPGLEALRRARARAAGGMSARGSADSAGAGREPAPWPSLRAQLGMLILQAGFSNRYLQASGFQHLLSVLSLPQASSSARSDLAGRMLASGNLNTHPVMAAALLGAVARVLSDAARGPLPRSPLKLITVGGSVMAQWGDRALWGGLRPALALLALALLPLSPAGATGGFLLAGLTLHVAGRAWLYRWGWRAGWAVFAATGSRRWMRLPDLFQMPLAPLAFVAAVSLCFAAARADLSLSAAPAALFSRGLLWFTLGIPCGLGVGVRPIPWGWVCWGAGLAAAFLYGGVAPIWS